MEKKRKKTRFFQDLLLDEYITDNKIIVKEAQWQQEHRR